MAHSNLRRKILAGMASVSGESAFVANRLGSRADTARNGRAILSNGLHAHDGYRQ